ncbi:MAG TPA: glycosyltransferase family 4 protein [Candidatus Peribacterales bacterium]|nr:glycosyltransferase family 4 protein [Candidatus Peribacterales bacterium]
MSLHSLMFGWEYPPKHLGGLGVACQGIVQGLLKHGARVTLVLPHGGIDSSENLDIKFPTESRLKEMRIKSMLQPYDSPATFNERLAQEITKNPRADVNLYGKDLGEAVWEYEELAVELTKEIKPDVVHSHDWMTLGAGRRAARYHRVPLVAQVHATELDRTDNKPNMWIYEKEQKGLHAADHIIAVSNYTKEILVREYGIRASKIDVVHNGAPFAATSENMAPKLSQGNTNHPMVLFIGRLTVQKGPFHFLEAARTVHNMNPDVRFVMAGDGYLLSELMERSLSMGLHDAVIFAGKVSNHEARKLYEHASCFVMPSISEPFGLVALEAIAHGTPVILSKQSGVREVVPHSLLVDFWDTEKLADCILTVLRETPLALQLQSEAPRVLQHLTWENQAAKILSVYDKARINL